MSKTPDELAIDYCEPILSDDYARAIGREDWIGTRCVKVGEGHEMYKAFLAGYKAAQQWISVKDRLPEIYQRVLILIRGRIFISSIEEEYGDEYRDGVIRFWDGDWDWPEVTHWMPLPSVEGLKHED